MKDYRTKNVVGMICDVTTMKPKMCNVTVQMTSDKIGKSLSLAAYNIMIQIRLEDVADIIKMVERGERSEND